MLKSTDSIACSWEKSPTKRTTIAAPSSATLVRCIFSLAITRQHDQEGRDRDRHLRLAGYGKRRLHAPGAASAYKARMDIGFSEAVLLFGGLLAVVAALSGLMRGTVLSASVLSVALGIVLAALDVVSVDANTESIVELVELALILTLFSDGMFVEQELLRRHWSPVARSLVIAMPITLVLLALAAKALFPEPRLGRGLPARRRALADRSGRHLGRRHLARWCPARSATRSTSSPASTTAWRCPSCSSSSSSPGRAATRAAKRRSWRARRWSARGSASPSACSAAACTSGCPGGGLTARYEGIYSISFALVAFGLAESTIGNGLIAAFVCGIALGATEHDVPQGFVEFAENASAIFQVLTFFAFGALIVATGFHHSRAAAGPFIVFALIVARPVAVLLSFVRTGLPRSQKAFMAWFGPKGVASMLFALLVLKSNVPYTAEIFDVAAFTIIASIVAHGLTDTVGARWLARRGGLEPEPEPGHLGSAGMD